MSAVSNDLEKLKAATTLNLMDKLSCAGVLGGTTVSLITQQVAFATVPISLVLALQIFSRQQKVTALVESHQNSTESIQQVSDQVTSLTQHAEQMLQEHERSLGNLTQESNKHNLEAITLKERLDEQAKSIAAHAGQIDALENTLTSLKEITAVAGADDKVMSADAHFTRGTHQEKLGHLEVAIDDYSQAIELAPDFAEAFLKRGLAKAKLGRRQSAVIDLNLATKYFFESGDLDRYQEAKDIAENIHKEDKGENSIQDSARQEESDADLVSINGLFGS